MITSHRWQLLVVVVSMIAAIAGSGVGASAEPKQLHEVEAEAAQAVIDQLNSVSDQPLTLQDLELDGLGPPPWTSFVPNRDPAAIQAWQMLLQRFPELRGDSAAPDGLSVQLINREKEPSNKVGDNDTPETGEPVVGFGTGADDSSFARISGFLYEPPPPPDCESIEDDGAIPSASPTNVSGPSEVHLCTGVLGDGPHGETTGDFDIFIFHDALKGSSLMLDVVPSRETNEKPQTSLAFYDEAGTLLASLDDRDSEGFLEVEAPADGNYYGVIGGLGSSLSDPFDSGSGSGATTTGRYEVYVVNFFHGGECSTVEDDGSITSANDVSEVVLNQGVAVCESFLGDGPHGDTSGDFDFYFLGELFAGESAIVDVFAPEVISGATAAIYDSAGIVVGSVVDDGSEETYLEVEIPADGQYYALVGSGLPSDPFDSASGSGAVGTGEYGVALGVLFEAANYTRWSASFAASAELSVAPEFDTDFFLLDLEAGDVISAGFDPELKLGLYDPDGELLIASQFMSPSFSYPLSSPLRHIGDVGIDHVAATTGTYALSVVDGFGPYEGELRITRPGRETAPGADAQIIYLDFDGASTDPSLFDPFAPSTEVELSPLSSFLAAWGLARSDENKVIDAVIAEVNAELRNHLRTQGPYGDRDSTGSAGEFDVEIRNSRDHPEMWGKPNVSRVIIGGTTDELQISTIGIASSIDPGNLDPTDSAVVLLDTLSADPDIEGATSLNAYGWVAPHTKAEIVGTGIGVIVVHEIGHFIGNWHTETFNESFQIMDAGGDMPGTLGSGPDLIIGTDDDSEVHFGTDAFNSGEGFLGHENTEVRSGFAMRTGPLSDDGPPTGLTIDDLANHVNFADPDAQVLRLYVAFFNRQPEINGANYWVGVRSGGSTLGDISGFFTLSQEFKNNYAGTTDEQFLAAVYENVLGREYDQSGFNYWLGLLVSEELDRGGVVMWISLNDEFADDNRFGGH